MTSTNREQTTLRLPGELMDAVRRQARERGDSLNETIIRLVRMGLEAELNRERPQTH